MSSATLSSDSGEVVSVTWDASLLATADGSAVEVRIVGHASTGTARTVEVGAVEWLARSADDGLYFLRARYYDPETGRFLGRDPLPLAQRYAYAAGNPASLIDPTGLLEEYGRSLRDAPPSEWEAAARRALFGQAAVQDGNWTGLGLSGPITSGFGMRISPIDQQERFHYGVDIGAAGIVHTPHVSEVVAVGADDAVKGNYVLLRHPDGSTTEYFHLRDAPSFEVGQLLRYGDAIGATGRTGASTGVHLHLELAIPTSSGLQRVDPLGYIDLPY